MSRRAENNRMLTWRRLMSAAVSAKNDRNGGKNPFCEASPDFDEA